MCAQFAFQKMKKQVMKMPSNKKDCVMLNYKTPIFFSHFYENQFQIFHRVVRTNHVLSNFKNSYMRVSQGIKVFIYKY
jgi:hypothetical protein